MDTQIIIFIATIANGLFALLLIFALKQLTVSFDVTLYRLANLIIQKLGTYISFEAKKTRKEMQEIKTRQTQMRKDLNKIEASLLLKGVKKMTKKANV